MNTHRCSCLLPVSCLCCPPQDAAYHESLRADREKEEAADRLRREAEEAARAAAEEAAAEEQRQREEAERCAAVQPSLGLQVCLPNQPSGLALTSLHLPPPSSLAGSNAICAASRLAYPLSRLQATQTQSTWPSACPQVAATRAASDAPTRCRWVAGNHGSGRCCSRSFFFSLSLLAFGPVCGPFESRLCQRCFGRSEPLFSFVPCSVFIALWPLQAVFDFVDVQSGGGDILPGSYSLATSYPRRVLENGAAAQSLADAGLVARQEALFLELK